MENQVNPEIVKNEVNDVANQSGNMYSYHEDNVKNNVEYPQETNAIRRSVGDGNPKSLGMDIAKSSEQRIPPPPVYNQQQQIPQMMFFQNNTPQYIEHLKYKAPRKHYIMTYSSLLIFQIVMIVLIGCLFEYDDKNKPKNTITGISYAGEELKNLQTFFKDVHLMVFVGFGMLFTLLKHHNWSSVSINLIVGVTTIEFSFFSHFLWRNTFNKDKKWKTNELNFENLIYLEFNALTVLISLGTVIGKLSIPQYLLIAILESFTSAFNFYLCRDKLYAPDIGGSMYVYLYGGLFGVIMSLILFSNDEERKKILESPHKSTNYNSTILSFIGTILIWVLFPSVNTSLIVRRDDDDKDTKIYIQRYRGIVNTYLSMCGSVIGCFSLSPIFNEGKMKIEQILNSSYVGGVIIAGCCNICGHAWASLLIGFLGSSISTVSMQFIKAHLDKGDLEDILGVLHNFVIPGFLGGILSTIFISDLQNIETYSSKQGFIDFNFYGKNNTNVDNHLRYPAGIQIAALFITFGISLFCAVFVGFIVKFCVCQKNEKYYVDSEYFIEGDEVFPEYEFKYAFPLPVPAQNLSSSGNKINA